MQILKKNVFIAVAVTMLLVGLALGASLYVKKSNTRQAATEPTQPNSSLQQQPTGQGSTALAQGSAGKAAVVTNKPAVSAVTDHNPAETPVLAAKMAAAAEFAPSKTGVLIVHAIFDGSGNGCGLGPTGTCMYPFARRTIEVRNLKGTVIATGVTDSNGIATFKLPAGTYKVGGGPGSGVNPEASLQQVTVTGNNSTDVEIYYWAIAQTNVLNPL